MTGNWQSPIPTMVQDLVTDCNILSLFAALNTATGEVLGKTADRHTSEQFVTFLDEIVASQTEHREIHVICDSVSRHKTAQVQQFLAAHPTVQIHCTPNIFILAQPGRKLVFAYPTRRYLSWNLHFHQRPRQKAHAIYPSIQQGTQTHCLEVR